MNVVDSSGWLEYFADGPNADFFSEPIQVEKIIEKYYPDLEIEDIKACKITT